MLTDSAPSQKAVSSIQEMQSFVISPGFLVITSSPLNLTLVIRRSPNRNMHCARDMGCAKVRSKVDAGVLIRLFTNWIVECGCNPGIRRCYRRSSTGNATIQPMVPICVAGVRCLHIVGGNCLSQQSIEYLQYQYSHANSTSHLSQG